MFKSRVRPVDKRRVPYFVGQIESRSKKRKREREEQPQTASKFPRSEIDPVFVEDMVSEDLPQPPEERSQINISGEKSFQDIGYCIPTFVSSLNVLLVWRS